MRVVYVCSSQHIGYTAAVAEMDRCEAAEQAAIEAANLAQAAADIAIAAWEAFGEGVSEYFFIRNICI